MLVDLSINHIYEGEKIYPSKDSTKEEMKKIRDQVKENMISAAQSAGAGNVPAEIERMIKELTEPKMNWRELLQQQIIQHLSVQLLT